MTTDSGGWTLIANISDDGDDVWSGPASDAGLWDSTDTLGTYSITADYKSQAYMDVAGTDILIKEEGTNVLYANTCFTEQSFQVYFWFELGWNWK